MKLLPATSNMLQRLNISSMTANTANTQYTTQCFYVLLFTGQKPTADELNAYGNGVQWAANQQYTNNQRLILDRNADYVGGIGGVRPTPFIAQQFISIDCATGMATRSVSANNDTRNCYFAKDAVPTWFLLVISGTSQMNLATGLQHATSASLDAVTVCGTVGDENSSADLKILGGAIKGNAATPNDQTNAVILNDLILKFA